MKSIVFYAEVSADWAYLNQIIEYLKFFDTNIIRITSDSNDKFLTSSNTYYIGYGSARTFLFRTIKAKAIIMTLTDLGSFYLKKIFKSSSLFLCFSFISKYTSSL